MPTPEIFKDAGAVLSIKEAAEAIGLGERTIRLAIKSGEIPATIIGGRDPLRSGRGLGYRIKVEDLQAWYFGKSSVLP